MNEEYHEWRRDWEKSHYPPDWTEQEWMKQYAKYCEWESAREERERLEAEWCEKLHVMYPQDYLHKLRSVTSVLQRNTKYKYNDVNLKEHYGEWTVVSPTFYARVANRTAKCGSRREPYVVVQHEKCDTHRLMAVKNLKRGVGCCDICMPTTSMGDRRCWIPESQDSIVKGTLEDQAWKVVRKRFPKPRKNITVHVSEEYLVDLYLSQGGKCAYTGWCIQWDYKKNTTSASPDRIDPLLPYVRGNICWTHWTVNKCKQNLTYDEYSDVCHAFVAHANRNDRKYTWD